MTIDINKVQVVEFKPRVFTPDQHICEREVKFDNTGRIKVATCIHCGDKVWG